MKKKLILTIGLLAIGIALLVISLMPAVERFSSSKRIRFEGEAGEIYQITATTRITTKGIFSLKGAKLTYKVVDADNNVLAERTVTTGHTVHNYVTTYTINDFEGKPDDVIVEVHDVEFDNATVIALSSIIIVCASLMISLLVLDKIKRVPVKSHR